ncbi:fasciclin-like arabinogalactan protein 14 [Typha latifolia]|uniref:fasciclin-like arabinogalactan protein 14 n=1 Tax=Typha latifolia TaxID=4733 RepID=UPI003C2D93B1
MASKATAAVVLPLLVFLFSSTSTVAHNITEMLADFSDFSTFNSYLTQTKIADEINSRETITVLAVDNSAIGPITSLSADVQKNVLAVHVILDYYDPVKLDSLSNKTALFTTLYQTTGTATGKSGFLNYTELPNEQMIFGSAEPGASVDSTLIKVIAAKPYNISVLQISKAIIPPGIQNSGKASPPPAQAAAPPKKAPSPAPAKPGSPAPAPEKKPVTQAPVEAPKSSPPAPEKNPVTPAPVEAPQSSPPTESATVPTPVADASAPVSEGPVGAAGPVGEVKPHSSASKVAVGASLCFAIGAAILLSAY